MSKERARANNPALSRRTVVACMAAAPAASVPALADAPKDNSEILRLFHEHQAYRAWINDHAGRWPDEELDSHLDRLDVIGDRLMALPTTCAGDFAAKVIIATWQGEMFPCWETGQLWKEARALTGRAGAAQS